MKSIDFFVLKNYMKSDRVTSHLHICERLSQLHLRFSFCIALVFAWLISDFNLFDEQHKKKPTANIHILQSWTHGRNNKTTKPGHDSFINEIKCFNSFDSLPLFSQTYSTNLIFSCLSWVHCHKYHIRRWKIITALRAD